MAHATFGDCPIKTRDKLAASQFISSLANEEIKQTLRLGGFTNLWAALVRALEIEAVESVSQPLHQNEARTRYPPFSNRYPPRGKVIIKGSPKTNEERTTERSFHPPLKCWR